MYLPRFYPRQQADLTNTLNGKENYLKPEKEVELLVEIMLEPILESHVPT